MVKTIGIAGTAVDVQIALTVAGCPLKSEITNRVDGGAFVGLGATSPSVDFTVMTDQERANVRQMLHGDPASTAGNNPAHGHAEGRDIPFADPDNRTRVMLIASGKGGVGKSSITTNLAIALAARGKSVALIDADVWGFSIPRMLGIQHAPGRDRRHVDSTRDSWGPRDLDGVLRRGGSARHLARSRCCTRRSSSS